jgi:dTDP-glucose pyrophosphorylase
LANKVIRHLKSGAVEPVTFTDPLNLFFVESVKRVRNEGMLEEIAFNKGWISAQDVATLAKPLEKNQYGQYLLGLLDRTDKKS